MVSAMGLLREQPAGHFMGRRFPREDAFVTPRDLGIPDERNLADSASGLAFCFLSAMSPHADPRWLHAVLDRISTQGDLRRKLRPVYQSERKTGQHTGRSHSKA